MKEKKYYLVVGSFILLEILTNIISLIILPKPKEFDYESLLDKYTNYYENYEYETIASLEDKLSSPKKTSIAIIVFASFICFVHFIHIILFLLDNDWLLVTISVNIYFFVINWSMAISIIPKLKKVIKKYPYEFIEDFKSHIIGVVVLYSLSLVFIGLEIFIIIFMEKNSEFCDCCKCCDCCDCCDCCCYKEKYFFPEYHPKKNKKIPRNIIKIYPNTSKTETLHVQVIQSKKTFILFKNVINAQIYANLEKFIQQGRQKMIKLKAFYFEMRFIGLTTEYSIVEEITSIIIFIAKLLRDDYNDEVARICLEIGNEESRMLLLHYAFNYIIELIKFKIERGIYRRSINIIHTNLIQVLTQVERSIEQDEQGNLRVNFRVRKRIKQTSFIRMLNN